MTSLSNQKKVHVRHGHLLFTIRYAAQGSQHYHVISDSPTFHKTLGVREYLFFSTQVPDIFIGPEGNIMANPEQLALLDSIALAINSHTEYIS